MKCLHTPFAVGAVRLRELELGDLAATLEWRNRDGVRQQFKTSGLVTWEQHQKWFTHYLDKSDDIVFVVEDTRTGERIGQVSIYAIDDVKHRAEVGRFVAAPEHQGKGLMFEGIRALLQLARQHLGLETVYLEVRETNHRALSLYTSLGFVRTSSAHGLVTMERAV